MGPDCPSFAPVIRSGSRALPANYFWSPEESAAALSTAEFLALLDQLVQHRRATCRRERRDHQPVDSVGAIAGELRREAVLHTRGLSEKAFDQRSGQQ